MTLTGSDLNKPIVVFCVNSERFTGYNLVLRLAALGYAYVHWYRGGVEAWQVNGLPRHGSRFASVVIASSPMPDYSAT
jgi:rhodanese-related sulfurtransferase